MHWDKKNQEIIQKVKGLICFLCFIYECLFIYCQYYWCYLDIFSGETGECVMWFISQNNCAAEIIIQIWLSNLFTLLTSSAGSWHQGLHQGTHTLDEGCIQARATTPKGWGTDVQWQCSTSSQTLTTPCNDISRQHKLEGFGNTGFETEAIKEGTVRSREAPVYQCSYCPFVLTFL